MTPAACGALRITQGTVEDDGHISRHRDDDNRITALFRGDWRMKLLSRPTVVERAEPLASASSESVVRAHQLSVPAFSIVALVILAAVVGARAIASEGFYWADDYAHLLVSRLAAHDVHAVLNVWGRPLMTILYIPAALVGESLARVTSLILFLMSAALVVVAARRWALPHPLLAAVLLLGQPLPAMIGFSALPQTLFSTVLAGSFALRAANRHASSVLVISFLPLARLEGIAVLAVWALVLIVERRYRLVPLLTCGLAAWAVCGALMYSDPLWLYRANPYGLLGSAYGAAGLGYGFRMLPSVSGAVISACAFAAIPRFRRIDPALLLTAGGLLAFYVAAWTLPAFQTLATPVYLVCLSVPIALLAHHGVVNALTAFPGWRQGLGVALVGTACLALATRSATVVTVVACLLACSVFAGITRGRFERTTGALVVFAVVCAATVTGARKIESLPLSGAGRAEAQLASIVRPDASRVVASTHPAFDWFAGTQTFVYLYRTRKPRVGDYIIWDPRVGARLSSLENLEKQGYVIRWSLREGMERVVLLERMRSSPGQ